MYVKPGRKAQINNERSKSDSYLPELVTIISVPNLWKEFHKSWSTSETPTPPPLPPLPPPPPVLPDDVTEPGEAFVGEDAIISGGVGIGDNVQGEED